MKIISLLLSAIIFFEQGVAFGGPEVKPWQTRFKDRYIQVVSQWNQVGTFAAMIPQLGLQKSDQKSLIALFQSLGVAKQPLGHLAFDPVRLEFHYQGAKEEISLRILDFLPSVLFYDGNRIIEIKRDLSFKGYLSLMRTELKRGKGRSAASRTDNSIDNSTDRRTNGGTDSGKDKKVAFRGKGNSILPPSQALEPWVRLMIPVSEAQGFSPEYWTKVDQQRKANAEHQTQIAKYCILAFILAFGGFWAAGKIFASSPSSSANGSGDSGSSFFPWSESAAEKKAKQDKAKKIFEEVKPAVLDSEVKAWNLICEKPEEASSLKAINIGTTYQNSAAYSWNGDEDDVKRTIKATKEPAFSSVMTGAQKCCQAPPCGKWLAEEVVKGNSSATNDGRGVTADPAGTGSAQ